MFEIVTLRDTIGVPPSGLDGDFMNVLATLINHKYANRVLYDLGLGMTCYGIEHIGEGRIIPGEGDTYVEVVFQLLVFRPRPGELFDATVIEQGPVRVRLSVGFFDDIYCDAVDMHQESKWVEEAGVRKWFMTKEGFANPFALNIGDVCRVSLKQIEYSEPHAIKMAPLTPYVSREDEGDLGSDLSYSEKVEVPLEGAASSKSESLFVHKYIAERFKTSPAEHTKPVPTFMNSLTERLEDDEQNQVDEDVDPEHSIFEVGGDVGPSLKERKPTETAPHMSVKVSMAADLKGPLNWWIDPESP